MAESGKKSRKAITLETKVKIIKYFDEGVGINDISRRLQLARSTVYTVLKDREKYLEELESATPVTTTKIRKKDSLIVEMEKLLIVWINDNFSQNIHLSKSAIQKKAQFLFDEMKARRGEAAKDETFGASNGWFGRFKKRSNIFNIKPHEDPVDAETFCRELAEIIDLGGYTKDQIFNIDETGLFWKKMPSKTFIAKEEQIMTGLKAAKDRLTLLLGANCSGNYKLKPLIIYNAENPRALKSCDKTKLPVYWRSNRKACVTTELFEDWLENLFVPEVKSYCHDNKIPFKILLILDNASAHSRSSEDINPDVKLLFLPSNNNLNLHPMNQIVEAFKHYYLMRTFTKCIEVKDREEGNSQEAIKLFWKNFNILNGIKTIKDAWDDVTISTLQGAWRKLCPHLFNKIEDVEVNPLPVVTHNIVDMARQLELDVDVEDITELMESHSQPLTSEELLDLEEDGHEESESEDVSEDESSGLTVKLLLEGLLHFETGMAFFEKYDSNYLRTSKLKANTIKNYACYYEMLKDKLKNSRKTAWASILQRPSMFEESFQQPSTSRLNSFKQNCLQISDTSCDVVDEEEILLKKLYCIRNKKYQSDSTSFHQTSTCKRLKIQEDYPSSSTIRDNIVQDKKQSSQSENEIDAFVKSILSQVKTLPNAICNSLLDEIENLINGKINGNSFRYKRTDTSLKNYDEGVFEDISVKSEVDIQESNIEIKEEILD